MRKNLKINVKDDILKIFEENGFFYYMHEPLFLGNTPEEIKKEASSNIFTFSLSDEDKDIVKPNDLKAFIDCVREIRLNQIKEQKINRPIMFRVWHDTMDNWLRYNLLTKNDSEITAIHQNPYLTFVDNVEDVFIAFLSDKEKNRTPLEVPDDAICPLDIIEEEERLGLTPKEFYIGNFDDEDEDDPSKNYTSYEEILNI